MSSFTTNQLFDLVAPIAICGGADCCYEAKAVAAWEQIAKLPADVWRANGCPDLWKEFGPLLSWNLRDNDDFQQVYDGFALPAYVALFEAIMGDNGDDAWEAGRDYWGAKGYKRPGDSNKNFSLAGDSCGQLPWYETADLLIRRIKQIQGH